MCFCLRQKTINTTGKGTREIKRVRGSEHEEFESSLFNSKIQKKAKQRINTVTRMPERSESKVLF